MKLGFLSAILGEYTLEQVLQFAQAQGFHAIEAACWPSGKAERRYAGVSHIDISHMTEQLAEETKALFAQHKVELSAVGYYPNPLHPDKATSNAAVAHLYKCIDGAALLGVNLVNTFIGKDRSKSVSDNMKLFKKVWTPIIAYAEEKGVKIGIENCPMYFKDEWPGGDNLASSPAIWSDMFSAIESDYFGLNYDPSHLVWQRMDYIKPIEEFKEKIFHIHIKDAIFYQEKFDRVGFLAAPLAYHAPVLPGHGDIDWGRFFTALNDIAYKGHAIIEIEDRAYEENIEDTLDSICISQRYIKQFV